MDGEERAASSMRCYMRSGGSSRTLQKMSDAVVGEEGGCVAPGTSQYIIYIKSTPYLPSNGQIIKIKTL